MLFAASGTDEVFGAACAVGAALDEAGWGLYPTSILPLVLSSTARHVATVPAPVVVSTSPFDVVAVSSTANALTLLARLAFSGRLYEAYEIGGHSIVSWEATIGAACADRIRRWMAAFQEDNVVESQVS